MQQRDGPVGGPAFGFIRDLVVDEKRGEPSPPLYFSRNTPINLKEDRFVNEGSA